MKKILLYLSLVFILILMSCSNTAKAVEYYEIGMAYFELGKYPEAEIWLDRARQNDKTMTASTYNLGRLSYEQKRYSEAALYFENLLKRDPDNIHALRAAAFSRIRSGDIEIAERHYTRLFSIVPENADDGYNHALVLFAMERYEDAKNVLDGYPYALYDNYNVILLYARILAARNDIESLEYYSYYLNGTESEAVRARARYEYAGELEKHEYYARALEEYRKAHSEIQPESTIKKYEVSFALAKVLLIADGSNNEGIIELENAVSEGFDNLELLEDLADNSKINSSAKERIRNIIAEIRGNEHSNEE